MELESFIACQALVTGKSSSFFRVVVCFNPKEINARYSAGTKGNDIANKTKVQKLKPVRSPPSASGDKIHVRTAI